MAARNWMLRRMLIETIRRDPAYDHGDYVKQPPSLLMANVLFGIATNGGTLALQQRGATHAQADQFVDAQLAQPAPADANDFTYQWDASFDYDPAPLLATLRSIHAARFPVHRLKLEIAETVLMRRPDAIHAVVAELQGLGIGFAIDDFGTGVTSLDSLRRRPVNTVKIDRAFVAQIGTADGEKLLRSLLEIAAMSGAAVIAEGVELPTQRDFLRQSGCGFGQGYLLGEPMDGALLGVFALTHAVQTDGVQSDIKKSLTERLIRRGA